jgi:hypothetical protein
VKPVPVWSVKRLLWTAGGVALSMAALEVVARILLGFLEVKEDGDPGLSQWVIWAGFGVCSVCIVLSWLLPGPDDQQTPS